VGDRRAPGRCAGEVRLAVDPYQACLTCIKAAAGRGCDPGVGRARIEAHDL